MALHFLRTRPALATALGVVLVAAALLMIPISYERTVGYDVTLTLAGNGVPRPRCRRSRATSRRRWALRARA
jgi:hypothetical protein